MLAVTGGKGGVGKTTTALGVARALGERGEEVLLVDADRDLPDLARTVGVETVRATPREVDTLSGHDVPDWSGVRLLTLPRESTATRRVLDVVADRPERVVLDCPAGSGQAAVSPLRAADCSLLVTTAHPASLRDAVKTAAIARCLDTCPLVTIVNRCDTVRTAHDRLFDSPIQALSEVENPLSSPETEAFFRDISTKVSLRNC